MTPEIQERECERVLLEVLQTLDAKFYLAEILLRKMYWGQSYDEIGIILKLPKETVCQRFYKALRCLRHPLRIRPLQDVVPWDFYYEL